MPRRPTSFVDRITQRPPLSRARRFFLRDLWMIDLSKQGYLMGRLTRSLRILAITVRGTLRDEIKKHAQALTYITVFSMIPLLAFGFAIAKGFGLYSEDEASAFNRLLDDVFGERAKPTLVLDNPVSPAGDLVIELPRNVEEAKKARPKLVFGPEAQRRSRVHTASSLREGVEIVRKQAEQADLKALGAIGLLFLLYAAIRMLGALEESLNEIYGFQRQRTLIRKITDYTVIMVITPAIVIGGTVWMQRNVFTGDHILLTAVPLLLTSLGMAFALFTFPNGPVNALSAMVGGVTAGAGWQLVLFLIVQGQIGLARLEGLYATFAAIPMLLLFFYFSWWVLLLGGEVAYAHQTEPVFTSIARTGAIDQAWRESLAPRIAGRVTHAFLHGERPPSSSDLASRLGVPPRHVAAVIDELVAHELLARVVDQDEDEAFLPGRDPETITILDLLEALRHDGEINVLPTPTKLDRRVDAILSRLRAEARTSGANQTLVQLARSLDEEERLDEVRLAGGADDAPGVAAS